MADYHSTLSSILGDENYLSRLSFGRPRKGHPEGTLEAHVKELKMNLEVIKSFLEKLGLLGSDWEERETKLKILIHTHDTFKADSLPQVAIMSPQSHASLARDFASRHLDDQDLLEMVQLHDVPYSLYRQFKGTGDYSHERLEALFSSIHDWQTFLLFQIIDNTTCGKNHEPTRWFISNIASRIESSIPFEKLRAHVSKTAGSGARRREMRLPSNDK